MVLYYRMIILYALKAKEKVHMVYGKSVDIPAQYLGIDKSVDVPAQYLGKENVHA